MTDPITCPECNGAKVYSIGSLTLACTFCGGRGHVGGDYEPAEGGHQRTDGYRNPIDGERYDPDVHGPLPSIRDHSAVQGMPCTQCLGSGEVINFGTELFRGDKAKTLLKAPCPACNPR